nr:unnamed protein product [Callosobruchus analis]
MPFTTIPSTSRIRTCSIRRDSAARTCTRSCLIRICRSARDPGVASATDSRFSKRRRCFFICSKVYKSFT